MKHRLAAIISVIALAVLVILWLRPSGYCDSAYEKYGLKIKVCPNGTPRQVVSVWGRNLKRAGDGEIEVAVRALYTTAKADEAERAPVLKFKSSFFLVDAKGEETPLPVQGDWTKLEESRKAFINLPAVDDGDYLLRTKVKSKVGESVVDMKLALYAPARIHLLTDRPLYEPGNLVQFRALALRARDFTPIDNRPGTWLVRSPSGEVLLEEKAPAGEWGVIAGDFPLADDAQEGDWSVSWRSGQSEESTSFRVEPFVLPRFRVEGSTDKGYYQAGERPELSGSVVYSSGAPVADAKLEINWTASGAWPPPNEWLAGSALPRAGTTDAGGRFSLQLPEVPADLRGRCTLHASISAVDPAGDRVAAGAKVLLSEDAIQVSAVTELEGGLVESTNNRVYLRVTSPEGFAMGGAKINVKRAWAPGDEGIDAELDEDGVARIQFDPGRPVSVVVPPMPVRKSLQSSADSATLNAMRDLVSNQQASIADQIAAESWLEGLRPCSRWVRQGSENASVSFRVSAAGQLSSLTSTDSPLSACVAERIKLRRLPAGKDRLYSASFLVQASDLPSLRTSLSSSLSTPNQLQETLDRAAADARICLPTSFEGPLPWMLFWRANANSKSVSVSWMKETGSAATMPAGLDRCILNAIGKLELPSEASANAIGVVRYEMSQPRSLSDQLRPQPTIMQGYELTVRASMGADVVGETKLRMQPGAVPDLRLRANPVVAKAGEDIDLAFFRGPNYSGEVPDEIQWSHEGDYETIELKDKAKSAIFKMPDDAKGWYEFSAGGARALVFVRGQEDLSLSLTAAEKSYQPGATAKLQVQTRVAGKGHKAAVGLFGVDNSLSQITTLRGPDDLGSIRPAITMHEQAFGALDAQALSLGRIRGAHAAEATILRVQSVPSPEEMDVVLYESAETEFQPITELTDDFYVALAELHLQTRAWESSAAEGETITPKQMAKLWASTLKACKARGNAITDAYGRPLRLHWLPSDLLALTDPAQVVADATRLPEDVENWQQWVMKEQP